ncbi:MAG: 50S ribosomal protein L36 [Veillonella parvula]
MCEKCKIINAKKVYWLFENPKHKQNKDNPAVDD